MISLVSMCTGLMAQFLLVSVYPVTGYCCHCKAMCEKYRQTDDAFTLNCDHHPRDHDCRSHCWFCKGDICDDYRKIYSCPENPDKKSVSGSGLGVIIIIVIVVAVIVVIISIVGCVFCCIYYGRRRNGPMVAGGRGMGVPSAYPMMTQQNMHYPTATSMTTVQQMPSQQQHQNYPKT